MTLIKINFQEVDTTNSKFLTSVNEINDVTTKLTGIKNSIPSDVRNRRDLENRLNSAINELREIQDGLNAVRRFVNVSLDRYENLERELLHIASEQLTE